LNPCQALDGQIANIGHLLVIDDERATVFQPPAFAPATPGRLLDGWLGRGIRPSRAAGLGRDQVVRRLGKRGVGAI
jgi:hypothetical protein